MGNVSHPFQITLLGKSYYPLQDFGGLKEETQGRKKQREDHFSSIYLWGTLWRWLPNTDAHVLSTNNGEQCPACLRSAPTFIHSLWTSLHHEQGGNKDLTFGRQRHMTRRQPTFLEEPAWLPAYISTSANVIPQHPVRLPEMTAILLNNYMHPKIIFWEWYQLADNGPCPSS